MEHPTRIEGVKIEAIAELDWCGTAWMFPWGRNDWSSWKIFCVDTLSILPANEYVHKAIIGKICFWLLLCLSCGRSNRPATSELLVISMRVSWFLGEQDGFFLVGFDRRYVQKVYLMWSWKTQSKQLFDCISISSIGGNFMLLWRQTICMYYLMRAVSNPYAVLFHLLKIACGLSALTWNHSFLCTNRHRATGR